MAAQRGQAAEQAQAMALQALGFLLADAELLGGFMAQAGLSPDDLRQRAADPDLLAAVLDFLLADDGLVIGFAASLNIRPETVLAARQALPGGDTPFWT